MLYLCRVAVLIPVVLLAGAGVAAAQSQRLSADRPLSFVDADGRAVRSTDFRGKWLLVYFGYMHCADLCPTGLTVLANALDQIGPAARHVQPLFVTVDPERDHGPPLRTFTAAFDKRLLGLSGSVDEIKTAAAALGVSFTKVAQGADYVVDHSSSYALVDPAHARAEILRIAEPHMLAAKLIDVLAKAGVPLDNVNNAGAYR